MIRKGFDESFSTDLFTCHSGRGFILFFMMYVARLAVMDSGNLIQTSLRYHPVQKRGKRQGGERIPVQVIAQIKNAGKSCTSRKLFVPSPVRLLCVDQILNTFANAFACRVPAGQQAEHSPR